MSAALEGYFVEVVWLGRGGQGCFTAARALGAGAIHGGAYALAFPSFGPERRGAPVWGSTKLSDRPIKDRGPVERADYLVVLDRSLLTDSLASRLKESAEVLVPSEKDETGSFLGRPLLGIAASERALAKLGRSVVNTFFLGALAGASGLLGLEELAYAIEFEFSGKTLAGNQELAREGFTLARNLAGPCSPWLAASDGEGVPR